MTQEQIDQRFAEIHNRLGWPEPDFNIALKAAWLVDFEMLEGGRWLPRKLAARPNLTFNRIPGFVERTVQGMRDL